MIYNLSYLFSGFFISSLLVYEDTRDQFNDIKVRSTGDYNPMISENTHYDIRQTANLSIQITLSESTVNK